MVWIINPIVSKEISLCPLQKRYTETAETIERICKSTNPRISVILMVILCFDTVGNTRESEGGKK